MRLSALETPTLIYCGHGNPRLAEIALRHGYKYGVQLPNKVYFPPLYFADQNWKSPDRGAYMQALVLHHPHTATVLDWERREQLVEVLDWAEEVTQYVQVVVVIPKVADGIQRLPHTIGGKEIRLGYSVPTRFGGTPTPIWEFQGWPVHLLGGSPHRQREMAHYLDVRSADGNMMNKMATQRCQFWSGNNPWWRTLQEAGYERQHDGIYQAFELSCINIQKAWKEFSHDHPKKLHF